MNVERLNQTHTISTHSSIHSQITSLPITSSVKFPYRIYVPHKSSVVEEGSFHWQLGTLRIYILGMRRREFGRGSLLVSSLIVYVPFPSLFLLFSQLLSLCAIVAQWADCRRGTSCDIYESSMTFWRMTGYGSIWVHYYGISKIPPLSLTGARDR